MIVDTSAVIAILRGEADAGAMARALERAPVRRMSVANFLEAGILTDSNQNPRLSRRLDSLLREVAINLESVSLRQVQIARDAYRDFGKGRHSAGLNFGDCFAYALAKVANEPLLCKGNDFRQTDIEVAET